jgi:hypothetical protein
MDDALLVQVVDGLGQLRDVELGVVFEESVFFVENLPEVSADPW